MNPKPTFITVYNAGSGEGARQLRPALEAVNRSSDAVALRCVSVDPVAGRARLAAEETALSGLQSDFHEGRFEDVAGRITINGPVIAQTDTPRSQLAALGVAREAKQPLFAFLMVKPSEGSTSAVLALIEPEDDHHARRLGAFWRALDGVTAIGGSEAFRGPGATAAEREQESRVRARFREHFTRTFPKVVAAVSAQVHPLLWSHGGAEPAPLFVLPPLAAFRDRAALISAVALERRFPMVRGSELWAAELAPTAIRLHHLRVRRLDGQFAAGPTQVLIGKLPAPVPIVTSTSDWTSSSAVYTTD